jgi:hypothetical protein
VAAAVQELPIPHQSRARASESQVLRILTSIYLAKSDTQHIIPPTLKEILS